MDRSLMTQLPAPSSPFNCHFESNFANIHWKLSKPSWIPCPSKAAAVCWLCNIKTTEQSLFTSSSEGAHTVYAFTYMIHVYMIQFSELSLLCFSF